VDDAQKYARGGLLPMSVFLTKNAPGLTQPGEARLPDRAPAAGRVSRRRRRTFLCCRPTKPSWATEAARDAAQHRANPACSSCHAKFDSFGLAFEGYGPIGETRDRDLAGRPVETGATFPDGSAGSGLDGLRAFMRARAESIRRQPVPRAASMPWASACCGRTSRWSQTCGSTCRPAVSSSASSSRTSSPADSS
jgi:hypothetical protein